MVLRFGVYASILKAAKAGAVLQKELFLALINTIDSDNAYGSGDNAPITRLMNCDANFPTKVIKPGSGAVRKVGETVTNIIQLSREISLDDLAESFENDILKLLSEDKKSALIGALKYVIANDESLHSDSKQTFESCMGMSLEQAESNQVEVILPRFLAGIFLYTLFTNDNKHKEGQMLVKEIGKPEFWNQFETYRITYTNECIKGFVPAPDDFGAYLEHLRNKHSSIMTLI